MKFIAKAITFLAVFLIFIFNTSLVYSLDYKYSSFDVPYANGYQRLQVAQKINDSRLIVGYYLNANGYINGYTKQGMQYSQINYPGATDTWLMGINNSNIMVGYYKKFNIYYGFTYDGNAFSTIAYPGSTSTYIGGINNYGKIIGTYNDGISDHAFTYDGISWSSVDAPGAIFTRGQSINDCSGFGHMVGYYETGSGYRGFFYNGSTFTTFGNDFPSSIDKSIYAFGINNLDNIVGYVFNGGTYYGYLYDNVTLTEINFPGSVYEFCLGINNSGYCNHGEIVGYYLDSCYNYHCFTASPVPLPGTMILLGAGLLCLATYSRRKSASRI